MPLHYNDPCEAHQGNLLAVLIGNSTKGFRALKISDSPKRIRLQRTNPSTASRKGSMGEALSIALVRECSV